MKHLWKYIRPPLILIGALFLTASAALAQDIGSLNARLNELSGAVSSAIGGNASEAERAISELDSAEGQFAKIASNPKVDRGSLMSAYSRLEDMLNRVYTTYRQKKEDCVNQIQNGGAQCDYDQPEQLGLKALYPLSWLRFQGAVSLYSNDPNQAKRLLGQAIDGFTESTLVIVAPELIRENLLGRAFCERELGKYDKEEYQKALADFDQIMKDGPATAQYKAAFQGVCTTAAAMGDMAKAAQCTQQLAGLGGEVKAGEKLGMKMLRLQNLFKAEAAASDPAKRAQFHKEAIDAMRGEENNKQEWAGTLAAVSQNVQNPMAEFGNSTDPFEQFLLASVLYSKKQYLDAAKYFLAAARSGKYPQAYKFAADIYYTQRRYDWAQQLVSELAKQPNNPDAQWAQYMRFKLARVQWEQTGMKNPQLEQQWITAARDYLKPYPHGQYAYEPRFRLAEVEQRDKQYLPAAQDYLQVSGNADYEFHAKFNAAECDYLGLVEAVNAEADSKNKKAPPPPQVNRDQLRKGAEDGLDQTIKMEPAVERSNPAQRATLRDIRGRAIYMLGALLEREPRVDYQRVAMLLAGYENQYPSMRDRFNDVAEWRIQALDQLGKYADLERDVRALVERNRGGTSSVDFMKEIGLDFWKAYAAKRAQNDQAGAQADAKLTAIAYSYFEDQVQAGRLPAKNLTGTLSILGKAYIALGDVPRAETIFNQVVKADPGSPDANAGLARIAQAKKDFHSSLELWQRVEQVAAESDDVWYEAIYNEAVIYAAQGNTLAACSKLRETRIKHPNLGTPEMKAQWDALQKKLCLQGA